MLSFSFIYLDILFTLIFDLVSIYETLVGVRYLWVGGHWDKHSILWSENETHQLSFYRIALRGCLHCIVLL